ncbi:MAG TPA: hypothetical protein ENH87_11235 [Pricia antarctica]|uniref:Uncharacterized protein n=1 Tax=Pricia antarctica TaxID=641691 RepID=A0A831VP03_9FLAO|nr:hypothetical protein [Pricia antarctica]
MNLKDKLQGFKKIKVGGMRFVIRKLNPLLDFPHDKIPQIFTSYESRRPIDPNRQIQPQEMAKIQKDMYDVIRAGVTEPVLHADGKDGLCAEDLFRNIDIGYPLYFEIIAHSLNQFKGLKKLFFSIKIKRLLYTEWRKNTDVLRQTSSLATDNTLCR